MLVKATTDRPTASAYAMLGYVQAEFGGWKASLDALRQAEQLNPGYALTYVYRGMVFDALEHRDLALVQLTKCQQIDPANTVARKERTTLNELGFRSLSKAGVIRIA